MKWLKLTALAGEHFWVRATAIESLTLKEIGWTSNAGAWVHMENGDKYACVETPEQILALMVNE
jgi:hypothetical protein